MRRMGVGMVVAPMLCAVAGAFAAVVPMNVGELTSHAQRIVIGDVVEVTSFWDEPGGQIVSRVAVQVSDYVLGAGLGIEVLEIAGGTVGDLTLSVSVLPVFEVGDHVLLFLDDETRLVGSFQGAYVTDGELVARMGPACVRVIEESLQPLADLLLEVERALPDGAVLPAITPYGGDFEIPLGGLRYGLCGYSWAYQADPMGETYKINANCVDASAGDAASQRTQIQNAAAAWNNAGADFVFTYGGTSSGTSVTYNGTNLVFFSTSPPGGGGYVAATYIWQSGGNISECDLVFNDSDYVWWNGSGTCSNQMDIADVATHELGHYLCLADLYNTSSDSEKTMYGYVSYCETKKRTLHSDDVTGIVAIYGAGCTAPTANAGPDKALCAGNTVVLQGGASGGSGGSCPGNYSPVWSGPGIVSGGSTFTPTVNATGSYTLTVSCGTCQGTDVAVVTAASRGDFDGDGGIDLADFDVFAGCLAGPNAGLSQPGCACGDFDSDLDVDFDDFAAFQDAFTN